MKHLTSLFDLTPADVERILSLAAEIKQQWREGIRPQLCQNLVMTLVFEKPSLRTRVSFEASIQQLGGSSVFLSGKDAGLEGREPVEDVAQVLGGYSDFIVLRTFSQKLIEDFARYSGTRVINGLSDDSHPCQALTDLMTAREALGDLSRKTLCYVGDGNNVARSLILACAQTGVRMTLAGPEGYLIDEEFLERVQKLYPDFEYLQTTSANTAVAQASIVYTDVWASMGQEAEKEQRAKIFAPYQVTTEMLDAAAPDVCFMHCLPARRGLEVTEDVMQDPRSIVFQQAENRMHLSKGLLAWLLES